LILALRLCCAVRSSTAFSQAASGGQRYPGTQYADASAAMQAGFATDAGDAENDSNPWWGPSGTSLDRNGLDVASDLYVPEADRLSPQDLDLARILRWRGQPYAVGSDGTLRLPLKSGVHNPGFKRQTCAAPPTSVSRIAWG